MMGWVFVAIVAAMVFGCLLGLLARAALADEGQDAPPSDGRWVPVREALVSWDHDTILVRDVGSHHEVWIEDDA